MRTLPPPVAPDADDQKLLDDTIAYYHARLKESPDALAYIKARGLDHPEVIDTFKLGVADRSLGLRLPEKNRRAGAEIRARLQKIGLLRESGHEHFNGSLVIPILNDSRGRPSRSMAASCATICAPARPSTCICPYRMLYIFNLTALQLSKEIILCEALIDALTFWCAGYRNVTSAYGVEGFTDEMLEAFQRHGIERVLIAFDRDEAEERGVANVPEKLLAAGIECFRIQFPKGMDANSYALKLAPAEKSLGLAIRKAVWLGKPVLNNVEGGAMPAEPVTVCDHLTPEPPSAPLPASPMPQASPVDVPCEVKDNEITLTLGDRRYRVRGLAKNLSFELLKINLLASRGDAFYVDTLDLYSAKQRPATSRMRPSSLQVKEDILKTDWAGC